MATEIQGTSSQGTNATRLPFRVLMEAHPGGPFAVTEPLDELTARHTVLAAKNIGMAAEMVENHRPRHRWGEAAFAAAPPQHRDDHLKIGACLCGKCDQTTKIVRLAPVLGATGGSPGADSAPVPGAGVLPDPPAKKVKLVTDLTMADVEQAFVSGEKPLLVTSKEQLQAALVGVSAGADRRLAAEQVARHVSRVGPTPAAIVLVALGMGAVLLTKLLVQLWLGGGL